MFFSFEAGLFDWEQPLIANSMSQNDYIVMRNGEPLQGVNRFDFGKLPKLATMIVGNFGSISAQRTLEKCGEMSVEVIVSDNMDLVNALKKTMQIKPPVFHEKERLIEVKDEIPFKPGVKQWHNPTQKKFRKGAGKRRY